MEKLVRLSESSGNSAQVGKNGRSRTKSLCINTNNIPYLPDDPMQKSYIEEVRFNFL